ncbi:DUF2231 domain-containing protein [Nocardioides pyridinolyticus]
MFDTINGLPVHILVVHVVVVLLPLAVLGAIAIAARPAWRVTYGPLVVGVAALSTALCPVATSSGEELERRVGDPGEHAELGETLVWFSAVLLVLALVLVLLERRRAQDKPPVGPPMLRHVVAVVLVITAVATGVQVYRVGDSGARSVWGDQISSDG